MESPLEPQPSPSDRSGSTAPQTGDERQGHRRPIPVLAVAAAAAVAVATVLFLVVLTTGGDQAPIESDDELAALAFLTADGSDATLGDFRGQPLVVNFFASWCAPCRAELPDLERVHQRNQGVTFLGINHDLDEATWRSFVEETNITYETAFQPQTEIFTALGAVGMPTTALVSPDGEVLHLHTGVLTDEVLQDLIDEHLARKA